MFHFDTMCGVEPVTVVLKMIYELLGDINLPKKEETNQGQVQYGGKNTTFKNEICPKANATVFGK